MKNRLSCIAASLYILAASNVNAASSVDLSVTGTITPSACTPVLSNGGVIDHGKISIKDITSKPLPAMTLQLGVNCDAATFFAIQGTDNREDSASNNSPDSFGLGLGENNHKLGFYRLFMELAMADGVLHPIVESVDGSTWFPVSSGQIWQPRWLRSVNTPGSPDHAPVAVKEFLADVTVQTTLNKPRVLTTETSLDGSATLDIVYL
ncbi:DUF1120 domain-containing protein [Pseudomonas sp. MYb118]|uniref:DUF1120 domain-containing protein n=1 Tax=Pseudomonas sp. MYb118 TaxID=1848720 RepID=UPI0034CDB0B5